MKKQYIKIVFEDQEINHEVLKNGTDLTNYWLENLRKLRHTFSLSNDEAFKNLMRFVRNPNKTGSIEDRYYDGRDFEYGYQLDKSVNAQNECIITGEFWASGDGHYNLTIQALNTQKTG